MSGFGRRFVVAGTFGLDRTRQASTLCRRHCWHGNEGTEFPDLTPCAFRCSQASSLFGLFLAVLLANTKPSTKNKNRSNAPT